MYYMSTFLCPRNVIRGHIVFVLSVTLSVCDSVAKNNLGHDF